MRPRLPTFEIFAISLAAVLLEISYTRVFSFKLYYYFTYFIIGIALLGVGSGGVAVAVSARLRRLEPERLVATCCVAGSAGILVGYWIVALLPIAATKIALQPVEVAKLVLLALALFAPYLAVGVAIATILGARPAAAGRLYGADLIGAGLGCTLSVPLMTWLSPPSAVMLAGAILLAAAFPAMRERGRGFGEWAALGAIFATLALAPGALPEVVPDENKSITPYPRISRSGLVRGVPPGIRTGAWYSKWHPVFRVDVTMHLQPGFDALVLHHDGQLGSALYGFDGDISKLSHLRTDARALPFALLPESPRVLIIGAAGGHEILASLFFGAREVVAVELNPVTVSLLRETYADFTGHLPEHDRVTLVNDEGRAFLARSRRRFDLIWLVAPDSYAAMNAASAGAYVLSESYLYTVEMIRESLDHLEPGGLLCAQFGEFRFDERPLRTTRFLATAREALGPQGVADLRRHALVATATDLGGFTLATVLLRATPYDGDDAGRFAAGVARVREGRLRYAPGVASDASWPLAAITLPPAELAGWLEASPYEMGPVRDDAPFFWHFRRFRDVLASPLRGAVEDWEIGVGERVLLALLAISAAFAVAALLLPFVAVRAVWRAIPCKLPASVYFAALGTGFMLLEVSLIQRFTLFLGYPTYSLSVTLFALLLSSGAGSLLAPRFAARRNRTLGALAVILTALVLLQQISLPVLFDAAAGAPSALRAAAAALFIAPLGLCLGTFMPLGLFTISDLSAHQRDYIAWAWAVNGTFSVISSVLAALLAMTLGFTIVQLVALGVYLVGIGALSRTPAPRREGRPS